MKPTVRMTKNQRPKQLFLNHRKVCQRPSRIACQQIVKVNHLNSTNNAVGPPAQRGMVISHLTLGAGHLIQGSVEHLIQERKMEVDHLILGDVVVGHLTQGGSHLEGEVSDHLIIGGMIVDHLILGGMAVDHLILGGVAVDHLIPEDDQSDHPAQEGAVVHHLIQDGGAVVDPLDIEGGADRPMQEDGKIEGHLDSGNGNIGQIHNFPMLYVNCQRLISSKMSSSRGLGMSKRGIWQHSFLLMVS